MTPLRQKMIEALTLKGYSPRTHTSYLAAITQIAKHYHRSPDLLTHDEIRQWALYLLNERGVSSSTCRLYINAIRFLFNHVLQRSRDEFDIPYPKYQQKIPEFLTLDEVKRIIGACKNPKHQMMLTVSYGCGLRVSEVVAIQVKDIDGERQLLHVVQGKGGKDRMVILSPSLLMQLRSYWKHFKPMPWLFPSSHFPTKPLTAGTAQKVYKQARVDAGIEKQGGIHALRHAYATHQLAAGTSIHQLKQLLGHQDIHSTLRYIHWLPNYQPDKKAGASDLISMLV
jgi:site-specific recombinase XerD